MEKDKSHTYLCPLHLGLAGGIYGGLVAFILTFLAFYTGFAREVLQMKGAMWPGFEISLVGGLIGFVYGFIEGFITLAVIAWIYNKLLCCSSCCKKEDESSCCRKDK